MIAWQPIVTLLLCALVGSSLALAKESSESHVELIDDDETTTSEIETTSPFTTTTGKQKRVNCGLQNFERTSDECCAMPVEDLFPMETTQKECNKKQSKQADTLLNGVMLNRLQDSRKNYQLDYSGLILRNLFGPGVCFADCIFQSNNLMTSSGDIDYQKTAKFITKGRSDPWKSILIEAVDMCKNFTDGTTVKEISFRENRRKKTCKTESVHVVQCLQAAIALNCPQDLAADHDKHKKCGEAVGQIQTCVGHIHGGIVRTNYLNQYLANKKTATDVKIKS
ncbi:uncharacterized protein LOC132198902 [Neocloeon triangulifer]|uniref:uncharacterized protein LOC132198902 n=1 Tax=Neocloeon triangulifer TaxID=2078957 RepID=UPI00286EC347|nr:uncharacterized protein LOC132198902 [Neocloeon triangulifer]